MPSNEEPLEGGLSLGDALKHYSAPPIVEKFAAACAQYMAARLANILITPKGKELGFIPDALGLGVSAMSVSGWKKWRSQNGESYCDLAYKLRNISDVIEAAAEAVAESSTIGDELVSEFFSQLQAERLVAFSGSFVGAASRGRVLPAFWMPRHVADIDWSGSSVKIGGEHLIGVLIYARDMWLSRRADIEIEPSSEPELDAPRDVPIYNLVRAQVLDLKGGWRSAFVLRGSKAIFARDFAATISARPDTVERELRKVLKDLEAEDPGTSQ